MKTLIVFFIALVACSCSSGDSAEAKNEAAVCQGIAGLNYIAPIAELAQVQEANFLVNKMWGTWPKGLPQCPAAWYCGWLVPNTCTQEQCNAGQCLGWTCIQYPIDYSPDGLLVSTTVAGVEPIDSRFALQPSAGGLSVEETATLAGYRALAVEAPDFYGCQ